MPTPLIVKHPIVADKVRQIRDASTSNSDFLRLSGEISRFVAYEAFRDIPTCATTVDTPVMKGALAVRIEAQFVIVPILRAGLGMTPAVQEVLPHHRVCLVGLRPRGDARTRRLPRRIARRPGGRARGAL